MFEASHGRLKVVGRAGVGVDNVDLAAATEAGCLVVNAPTANTVAAAEHGIALLCAMARNIPQVRGCGRECAGVRVRVCVKEKHQENIAQRHGMRCSTCVCVCVCVCNFVCMCVCARV